MSHTKSLLDNLSESIIQCEAERDLLESRLAELKSRHASYQQQYQYAMRNVQADWVNALDDADDV